MSLKKSTSKKEKQFEPCCICAKPSDKWWASGYSFSDECNKKADAIYMRGVFAGLDGRYFIKK